MPTRGTAEDEGVPDPSPSRDASTRRMRVFVSSTFLDMGAERDDLARRAFVELRRACEDRHVIWTDVDLRWGITDEQQAEGRVLPICLAEIENSRPFFIGILGERYGWVPDSIPADEAGRDPWLGEDPGRSITALEVEHGVLRQPDQEHHAFFYFRDPAYLDDLPPGDRDRYREAPTQREVARLGLVEAERRAAGRRRRLAELKDRIVAAGFPVTRYREPDDLSPLVTRDLRAALDRLFPAESVPSPDEMESAAHLGLMRAAEEGYIRRPSLEARLTEHAQGGGPPLVVTGGVGVGKTALLANWATARRASSADDPLLVHFVDASAHSGTWPELVRRLLTDIAASLGVEPNIPDEPKALRQAFAAALHRAGALGTWTLLIDGLDGLEDRDQAQELAWLPMTIPKGIRLILSTGPGKPLEEARRREWAIVPVEPLSDDERRGLVVGKLATHGKALSGSQLDDVVKADPMGNPLFAVTVLEELRVHGDPRTLDEAIRRLVAPSELAGLFEMVIQRLERDYEGDRPGLVRDAFSALWASRRGLGEAELLEVLGDEGRRLPSSTWSPLHLAARHLLVERSGLIRLAHEAIAGAVVHHFLPSEDDRREAHVVLVRHFEEQTAGPRRVEELPWQYGRSGRWESLAEVLSDLEFLESAWQMNRFDVRRYWAEVEARLPGRMVAAYAGSIEGLPQRRGIAHILVDLLSSAGRLAEARSLSASLVVDARRQGDDASLAVALGNHANLLNRLGRWDEALELHLEQEALACRAGLARAEAAALGGRASILRKKGDLRGALELATQEGVILARLDDEVGRQQVLGTRAQILMELGDLESAMQARVEQEEVCRRSGQLDGLASAVEGQSVLLLLRGRFADALERARAAEGVFRELGDLGGMATTLANQAHMLGALGDQDAALRCLEQTEEICRSMGESQDLVVALANRAVVLGDRGETESATRLFAEAEQICRSLGYRAALQAVLANRGRMLLGIGEAERALQLLTEAEAIARAIDTPRPLVECLNLKGSCLRMLGRETDAQGVFLEALDIVESRGLAVKR